MQWRKCFEWLPGASGLSNVPANRTTHIIHGRRGITGDTALRLGHWFHTSAQFWINLQAAYDLRLAREQVGQDIERLPTRQGAPTPAT